MHAFSFHCIKIRQLIKQWNEWKKEQKKCKLCIYAIYSNNNIASIRIWIESMNIIKSVSDAISFSDRQTDKRKETLRTGKERERETERSMQIMYLNYYNRINLFMRISMRMNLLRKSLSICFRNFALDQFKCYRNAISKCKKKRKFVELFFHFFSFSTTLIQFM